MKKKLLFSFFALSFLTTLCFESFAQTEIAFEQGTQSKPQADEEISSGLNGYTSSTNYLTSTYSGSMWLQTWSVSGINILSESGASKFTYFPSVKPQKKAFTSYLCTEGINVDQAKDILLNYSGLYRFGSNAHQDVSILVTDTDPTSDLSGHTNWQVLSTQVDDIFFNQVKNASGGYDVLDLESLTQGEVSISDYGVGKEKIWIAFKYESFNELTSRQIYLASVKITVENEETEAAPTDLAFTATEIIENTVPTSTVGTVSYTGTNTIVSLVENKFTPGVHKKAYVTNPSSDGLNGFTNASSITPEYQGASYTKIWSTQKITLNGEEVYYPLIKNGNGTDATKEAFTSYLLLDRAIDVSDISNLVLEYGGASRYGTLSDNSLEIVVSTTAPVNPLTHSGWQVVKENVSADFLKLDNFNLDDLSGINVTNLDLSAYILGNTKLWVAFRATYSDTNIKNTILPICNVTTTSNPTYRLSGNDVILNKSLDYFTRPSGFTITAANAGGATASSFNVDVIPVPAFATTPESPEITEGDAGIEVATIVEEDKGLAVTYTLEGDDANLFTLTEGTITTAEALEAATQPTASLIIKGTADNGQITTLEVQVRINSTISLVVGGNTSDQQEINEDDITESFLIGELTTEGGAENATYTYSISGEDAAVVSINESNEIVFNEKPSVGTYTFNIVVTNTVDQSEIVFPYTVTITESIAPPVATEWIPEIWKDFQEKGDKSILPNFSYAGYHNSEIEIPTLSVTHNAVDFGILPNDNKDDAVALNTAFEEMGKAGGGVLLLPKGQYDFLTNPEDLVTINFSKSNIVLRGEGQGEDGTVLYFHNQIPRKGTEFGTFGMRIWGRSGTEVAKLEKTAIQGDRHLIVDTETALKAGDFILITVKNAEGDDMASRKMVFPLAKDDRWSSFNRSTAFQWSVEVINVNGKHISIKEPLPIDLETRYETVISTTNYTTETGIENLRFSSAWSGEYKHHGKNEDGSQEDEKTVYEMDYGWCALQLSKLSNSWVKDVTFENFTWDLNTSLSKGLTLQGINVIGKDGHHGIKVNGYGNVLKDAKISAFRTHPIGGTGIMVGNVFTNIELGDYDGTVDFHGGGFPAANLIENVNNIRCEGSGAMENMPNSGIANVFWNLEVPNEISAIENEFFYAWWMALLGQEEQSYLMYPQSKVIGVYNPEASNVQIAGSRADRATSGIYVEGLNKKGVYPASVFQQQLTDRLAKGTLVFGISIDGKQIEEFSPETENYFVAHTSTEAVMPTLIVDTDASNTVTITPKHSVNGSTHQIEVSSADGISKVYTIHYGFSNTENKTYASRKDVMVRGGSNSSKNYFDNSKIEIVAATNSTYLREALLSFNVSSLMNLDTLTEVNLNITGRAYKGTSVSYEVVAAAVDFDETTVTFDAKPEGLFKRVGFIELYQSDEDQLISIPLNLGEISEADSVQTFIIREITNILDTDGKAIFTSIYRSSVVANAPYISAFQFKPKQVELITSAEISSATYSIIHPTEATEMGEIEGIDIAQSKAQFLEDVIAPEGGSITVIAPSTHQIVADVYAGCIVESISQDGNLVYQYKVIAKENFAADIIDDTYVTSQYPTENFATSNYLEIGSNDKATYLKFDLSVMESVDKVMLKLYADKTNMSEDSDINVFGSTATSWFANEVSYSTTLGTSGSDLVADDAAILAENTIPSMEHNGNQIDYYFDVSDYVKAALEQGSKEVTFKVTGSNWVRFSSSYSVDEQVPELIFEGIYRENGPTSIGDVWNADVVLYPVPATTQLTLKMTTVKEGTKAVFFNGMGQQVMSRDIKAQETVIRLDTLSSGMYYVNIISDGEIILKKFIKQ
ncbi:DNRLRE domain-containing protein [Flammeovirga kamogawensis]|uniref:DNRLRE domain-containing protein n=1 Tax=Flammeovirga kamogawensis TaxID=373891 RepID=A0ABX8H5Q6_9BACT|nr:DNRLRE domain-containing protein [Flammeovirga kamogawensis]MBB6461866.1 hypothetical protein [Flammeovirga kamogawensis]QWG10520.1 DNRLRE domain-containing protein [Flammeovirga kamogawensis]TRX63629.1 DNRLRE domain-containing protein [Flammeovirga kamogawensis]